MEMQMEFGAWQSARALKQVSTRMDADILCLQETKCQGGQVNLALPGYHQGTGIMPTEAAAIPEQQYLRKKNRCL